MIGSTMRMKTIEIIKSNVSIRPEAVVSDKLLLLHNAFIQWKECKSGGYKEK